MIYYVNAFHYFVGIAGKLFNITFNFERSYMFENFLDTTTNTAYDTFCVVAFKIVPFKFCDVSIKIR